MNDERILLIDGLWGINLPLRFYNNFDLRAWGIEPDDFQELKDPSSRYYDDAWSELLEVSRLTDTAGIVWRLEHDEHLWAVREGDCVSYEQDDLVAAINMIASVSPRIQDIIWTVPGVAINLDYLADGCKAAENTFSGSENVAYEFAISLWNGRARIRLDDILVFDSNNYPKIIKALMILRGIHSVDIE